VETNLPGLRMQDERASEAAARNAKRRNDMMLPPVCRHRV
jgi:hypothetical protein